MSLMLASLVLGVHLATAHSAGGLEPVTPGLYLRHDNGLTVGALRNSYDRLSTYAGWTWESSGRRFALTLGAVSGYPAKPLLPLVAPSMRLGLSDRTALRLALLPKPPRYGHSHALHLSLETAL